MKQLVGGNTEKGCGSLPRGRSKTHPSATKVKLPSSSCLFNMFNHVLVYVGSFEFTFPPSLYLFPLLSKPNVFLLPFVSPHHPLIISTLSHSVPVAESEHRSSSIFWHCQYHGEGQINNSAEFIPRKKRSMLIPLCLASFKEHLIFGATIG